MKRSSIGVSTNTNINLRDKSYQMITDAPAGTYFLIENSGIHFLYQFGKEEAWFIGCINCEFPNARNMCRDRSIAFGYGETLLYRGHDIYDYLISEEWEREKTTPQSGNK